MPKTYAREFLSRILENEEIQPEEIDELCQEEENLHHDFKSGELLKHDLKKAKREIREYVSAFANSDGGVLVLHSRGRTRRRQWPTTRIALDAFSSPAQDPIESTGPSPTEQGPQRRPRGSAPGAGAPGVEWMK